MTRYFFRQEVLQLISIRPELMAESESEGLVAPDEEGRYSDEAVERLRVIQTLVDELGVNMAGAEVILEMREELLKSHELFDWVVQELLDRLPR